MKTSISKAFRFIFIIIVMVDLITASEIAGANVTIVCPGGPDEEHQSKEYKLCRENVEEWQDKYGNSAQVIPVYGDADEIFKKYSAWLQNGSKDDNGRSIDVYQIDMIWTAALSRYFLTLYPCHIDDESNALCQIDEETIEQHFDIIIDNNRIKGRVKAMPWFVDIGLLYYRTDLVGDKKIRTWGDLVENAERIQNQQRDLGRKEIWGFIWQGHQYEGLTCNALEWLHSYGVNIDGGRFSLGIAENQSRPINQTRPINQIECGKDIEESCEIGLEDSLNSANINTTPIEHIARFSRSDPAAIDAAATAISLASSWIGKISPPSVLDYDENKAIDKFKSGNAVFMRGWPSAWQSLNPSQTNDTKDNTRSKVEGNVGVMLLPSADKGLNATALGGQQLAVYERMNPNHVADAVSLVKYLTSPYIQKKRADSGYIPTIKDLHRDEDVKRKPFFSKLNRSLMDYNHLPDGLYNLLTRVNVIARPSAMFGTNYANFSQLFSKAIHDIISGEERCVCHSVTYIDQRLGDFMQHY